MAGQINIDSTDIEETMSMLGDSVGSLENDTFSYINDCNVLEDLGLVDDSVTKVKRQVNDLVVSQNKVIKDLKEHLETYYQTENEIVDYINNFDKDKDYTTNVAVNSEYEESTMDNVSSGKNVTKGDVVKFIKGINEDIEKVLFNNIRKNATNMDTTIDELVLNPKKSGLLTEILKKLCGDTNTDIDTSNTLKTAKVQRTLANKMGTSHAAKMMKDTSLSALPYLNAEAEAHGFKLEDILYDPSKEDELLNGINNLYVGKHSDSYKPDDTEIEIFRNYINGVSDTVGITVEELLSDTKYLGDIKKGLKK